ncbi:hypothetical protein PMI29_01219 [Pseudomonas sp. GM49]
MTIGN